VTFESSAHFLEQSCSLDSLVLESQGALVAAPFAIIVIETVLIYIYLNVFIYGMCIIAPVLHV